MFGAFAEEFMKDSHPHLFPRPRRLEVGEVAHRIDAKDARFEEAMDLGADAYEIAVGGEGIQIRYGDEAGRRFAEQTLAQLARFYRDTWPDLFIADRPDFAVRGYMLDVSRDRVPTRATLERLVGILARLRINHLQLYTEHTFAYREHARVWENASPITPDDVRWLDGLCASHGIELAANQNVFGHMERWLKHEPYRALAECPDGWETPWGRTQAPSVLAPTEGSLALASSLFDELLGCFSSRRVNINCDETFELGRGRSREEVEARGRVAVYVRFVRQLMEGLHRRGKEVLFWADIARTTPALLADLPDRDATALVWHYEAPTDPALLPEEFFEMLGDFGITPETMRGFAEQVRPFAEADYPFWVCPGTSSWNSLIGRLDNARSNLLDAARAGRDFGAGGFLITDWGDSGHLQPFSVSLPPLAYGAAVAWCADSNQDIDTARFLDEEIFLDSSGHLATALERAGMLWGETGARPFNGSVLHYQLLGGGLSFLARLLGEPTREGLRGVEDEIERLLAEVGASRPECIDGDLVRREIAQALRLARHGAWRSALQGGFPAPSPARLREDLAAAIVEQRACWLERSRPGGLADSLARLEGTLAEYGEAAGDAADREDRAE